MLNNIDNFNDKFKKSAEDFSIIPSVAVWENIENHLQRRKRKKRFIILFFLLTGLLISGCLFYTTLNPTLNRYGASTFDKKFIISKGALRLQIKKPTNNKTSNDYKSSKQFLLKNLNAQVKQVEKRNKFSTPIKQSTQQNTFINTAIITSIQNRNSAFASLKTDSTRMASRLISLQYFDSSAVQDSIVLKFEIGERTFIKKDTLNKENSVAKKDTVTVTPKRNKWSVACGIAPNLNYTRFEEQGNYQFISNYRNSSDKNLITWNYHFNVNYKLIPRLELYSGIGITNFTEKILSQQAVYHYDTAMTSGPLPAAVTLKKVYYAINGDSIGSIKNKFSYLNIPIGMRYNYFIRSRFTFSLQYELALNKLIHVDGYLYNYSNFQYTKIKDSDLQAWNFSNSIGLSLQYTVFKNFNLEFLPLYTRLQKSIYSAAYPISQKLQKLEFRFLLRYNFK